MTGLDVMMERIEVLMAKVDGLLADQKAVLAEVSTALGIDPHKDFATELARVAGDSAALRRIDAEGLSVRRFTLGGWNVYDSNTSGNGSTVAHALAAYDAEKGRR